MTLPRDEARTPSGATALPGAAEADAVEVGERRHEGDGCPPESAADLRPRILLVGDAPRVLEGWAAILGAYFAVETADRRNTTRAALPRPGQFSVVVFDVRMPVGVELLASVRQIAPRAARIFLVRPAEFDAAVRPVDEANVSRLVLKPCPPDRLRRAIEEAVEESSGVTTERARLQFLLDEMAAQLFCAERLMSFGRTSIAASSRLHDVLRAFRSARQSLPSRGGAGGSPFDEDLRILDGVHEGLARRAAQLTRPEDRRSADYWAGDD